LSIKLKNVKEIIFLLHIDGMYTGNAPDRRYDWIHFNEGISSEKTWYSEVSTTNYFW